MTAFCFAQCSNYTFITLRLDNDTISNLMQKSESNPNQRLCIPSLIDDIFHFLATRFLYEFRASSNNDSGKSMMFVYT